MQSVNCRLIDAEVSLEARNDPNVVAHLFTLTHAKCASVCVGTRTPINVAARACVSVEDGVLGLLAVFLNICSCDLFR